MQLLAAGSGLGDDEGLQASRRRSRWLREGEGLCAEGGGAVWLVLSSAKNMERPTGDGRGGRIRRENEGLNQKRLLAGWLWFSPFSQKKRVGWLASGFLLAEGK